MAETRITITDTRTYNASLYRREVPKDTIIEGWGDDSRFFASVANDYMKIGWWVPIGDTAVYDNTPTEPPADDPTTPAGAILIVMPDGTRYTNSDPFSWVVKEG